jgi:hypothetical protein
MLLLPEKDPSEQLIDVDRSSDELIPDDTSNEENEPTEELQLEQCELESHLTSMNLHKKNRKKPLSTTSANLAAQCRLLTIPVLKCTDEMLESNTIQPSTAPKDVAANVCLDTSQESIESSVSLFDGNISLDSGLALQNQESDIIKNAAFSLGDLVWARMAPKSPFWPALITMDPITGNCIGLVGKL